MENVTTYVGIDAHKKDLFIAMLVGDADDAGDVAGRRTSRRRCGGWSGSSSGRRRARCGLLRSRAVRLRVAAPADDGAGELPGDRAGADSAEAGRADQDQSPRCAQAGGAAARRVVDRGAAADAGGRSGPRSVSRAR